MTRLRSPEYIKALGVNVQGSAHQDLAQVASTLGLVGLAAYVRMLWALVTASLEDPVALAMIVGMVFQAQVNPIPTDVLVVAAVVVGSRHPSLDDLVDFPAWLGPAILCAAVAMMILDLGPASRILFR
jgi:hypothetical protein